jgi:hypothetical protein
MPTKHTAHTFLNTSKTKVWRPDGPTQGRCIWEYHDVWRWSDTSNKAVALRENYFRQNPETGGKVRATQLASFSYMLIADLDSLVCRFLPSVHQKMERKGKKGVFGFKACAIGGHP